LQQRHQWPNPSLNVTTVEYQKPRTELLKRVLSNRTDSLQLYDQMSLWAQCLANLYCTNTSKKDTVVTGLTGDFLLSSNGSIERPKLAAGRISTDGQFNLSEPIERTGSRAEVLGDEGPTCATKKAWKTGPDLPLKDRLEGFSFELCLRITDFSVQFQNDSIYGDVVNGQWNGLIRSIMLGHVDLACVAMNPLSSRAEVIDFTASYLSYNMSLLYTEEPPDAWEEIFLFSQPYDIYTWLGNNVNFDLLHILYCAFSSLCRRARGRVDCRISRQLEFLVGAFWLFSLVVLINYAARLGAQLVLRRI
uniref:Lig_chan-Glu_bd domain-containing protein n=1 Tax=Macrostomum lignano TaxID=282301 RepID=A0A1I8FGI4_9PLAT